MNIEIVGTGMTNKGAALMLAAILDRFSQTIPNARFVVDPSIGSFQERARFRLFQKFDARRSGRLGWLRAALLHKGYRQRFGLATERDIAAVFDASGYSLGDVWPEDIAHSKARSFLRWRSQGKRIVLLPQAMGPFERRSTRNAYRQILEASDLAFARDPESFAHAQDLAPNHIGLRLARDFTNQIHAPPTRRLDRTRRWAALVPNAMMIRGKPQSDRAGYVLFLANCAEQLRRLEVEPCIVLYESRMDCEIAEELRDAVSGNIETLREEDPVELKGITGEFLLMIGSRFHGLINALSQGVPAIGTSWAHKYEALFRDFGRPEWYLGTPIAEKDISDVIENIFDTHEVQRSHLLSYCDRYRQETEATWQEVEGLLAQ